jgi:hypothetical protein
VERFSPTEARRIALAAQGFGAQRPDKVTVAQWRKTIDRLSLHKIDSVNILFRVHYLPAFSRLGPYDTSLIDTAAWGGRRQRRLFEYWAHEASLLPLDLHPLLRWRMARADRGEAGWKSLHAFATEHRAEAEACDSRTRQNQRGLVADPWLRSTGPCRRGPSLRPCVATPSFWTRSSKSRVIPHPPSRRSTGKLALHLSGRLQGSKSRARRPLSFRCPSRTSSGAL